MSNVLKHLSSEHRCGTLKGWVRRIEKSKRKGKTIPAWGAVMKSPDSVLRAVKVRFVQHLN